MKLNIELMKKYLLVSLIILFLTTISVFIMSSPAPVGIYIAKHNINTIDSLFINKDGFYKRVLYKKKDGIQLFKNTGKWYYKNERIVFTDFFPNDDAELQMGYNFNSVLMTYSVPLEKSFGRVVFDYDEISATYRFHKLFW